MEKNNQYRKYFKLFIISLVVLFFIFLWVYNVIKSNYGYNGNQWQILIFIMGVIPLLLGFFLLFFNILVGIRLIKFKLSKVFSVFIILLTATTVFIFVLLSGLCISMFFV